MRIRAWFFLWAYLLALPAYAETADVAMEGGWSLRPTTMEALTKDAFCASQANFARGYKLAVARNLLGQHALVITWPALKESVGAEVSLQVVLDKKNTRDLPAKVTGADTVVAAVGWDDAFIQSLGKAKRAQLMVGDHAVRLNLKDGTSTTSRLASCTASLMRRLPDGSALPEDVQAMLTRAGIKPVKTLAVSNPAAAVHFMVGDFLGGMRTLEKGEEALAQRMLADVDRLETLCGGRFSSEVGAPMPSDGGEIVTAEARCDTLQSGSISALVFFQQNDKARMLFFEGPRKAEAQVLALRNKLVTSTKSLD